jgi:D-ribose pyranose/furanose isomerase RbsD
VACTQGRISYNRFSSVISNAGVDILGHSKIHLILPIYVAKFKSLRTLLHAELLLGSDDMAENNNSNTESLEKTLFRATDKLRKNIDAVFKNNDQLKTNTALQMEAAKIEFKVIFLAKEDIEIDK